MVGAGRNSDCFDFSVKVISWQGASRNWRFKETREGIKEASGRMGG